MTHCWIVVPAFDAPEQALRLLEGLKGLQTDCHTILFVDHGPKRMVSAAIGERPGVLSISASPELWWAGATNTGIRFALDNGATHVLLLNNDCVIDAASVRLLIRTADETESVVAPVQRDVRTQRVLAVRTWPYIALGFPTLRVEHAMPNANIVPTPMIGGGRGAVIRRTEFERVGLFAEEALPHYYADHDFFLRCRRAGVPLVIQTDATVLVDAGTTSTAHDLAQLSWPEFRASLRDPRSHRNLDALAMLFRRHYPIRSMWWVGLALAGIRHVVVWAIKRPMNIVGGRAAVGRSDAER